MFAHCLQFEGGTRRAAAGHHARAWLLLLAILPTLTFMGHWPDIRIGIPGSTAWLTIPLASEGDHHHEGTPGEHGANPEDEHHSEFGTEEDGHGRHCHADAASCTNTPFTGISAFALLSESVALLGAGGFATLLVHQLWEPTSDLTPGPEFLPPRA